MSDPGAMAPSQDIDPDNARVRAALASHGDDGTRVRHVIHFAYPLATATAPRAEAEALVAAVIAGVAFTHLPDSPGVVFEQYREVASADFDRLTLRLAATMDRIGWTYDGWECAVETGEDGTA